MSFSLQYQKWELNTSKGAFKSITAIQRVVSIGPVFRFVLEAIDSTCLHKNVFPYPIPIPRPHSSGSLVWTDICILNYHLLHLWNSYSHHILGSPPTVSWDWYRSQGSSSPASLKKLQGFTVPTSSTLPSSIISSSHWANQKKKASHAWNVGEMQDKSCSSKVKYFKIAEQCHGLQELTKDFDWYSWRDMQQTER